MSQALSLARLAQGQVSPNPAVGAVIVHDGMVAGQGYTQPPGQAHAEIVALRQAGEKARGAVLYVTLEPCCHTGRTPPCTKAIITAGVAEVHLASIDDNPVVAGKGVKELESAGIKTIIGECEEEARTINEAYIKYITTGIPFITVKYAASLDGKIATGSGDSRWITGEAARKQVHTMRYLADAVMVGINTVLADNPQLTVRCSGLGGMTRKQPLRVVVDGKGRTPLTAQLLKEPGKALIALGRKATAAEKDSFGRAGAEVLEFPGDDGLVDLVDLMKTLGKRAVTSVLVEGGGILNSSLFEKHMVDKVVAFIAPVIIGGEKARTPVAGAGINKVADAIRLRHVSIERFDDDLMVSGYVEK